MPEVVERERPTAVLLHQSGEGMGRRVRSCRRPSSRVHTHPLPPGWSRAHPVSSVVTHAATGTSRADFSDFGSIGTHLRPICRRIRTTPTSMSSTCSAHGSDTRSPVPCSSDSSNDA